MAWHNGAYGKTRTNGKHKYAWDRPIDGSDVKGLLQHRKKYGPHRKLVIASGCHGTKDQYKEYADKDDFVPTPGHVQKAFYYQDKDTVSELTMQNVKVLNMNSKSDRRKWDEMSGVSRAYGMCHGVDNKTFRSSPRKARR
eukprot:CAMPEP_0201581044 /NCGR_PEP_ID=MMETSP0190_2-20130828/61498_1 /ASSEMBLY_ACC=CAM_ASM_000263 /TAXON_ID=37353 /ORGANISM="Rosalina sp." /LENGTH=139 /DNA_ID=CAMNT_0048018227 /DNA_START=35 /DNA_END=454 /DNA_ORIENTATION=+